MNNTLTKKFDAEINKAYTPLTKAEEYNLIELAQNGSYSARNKLVNSQIKQISNIARSYMKGNANNEVTDLIAIGVAGYQDKNGLLNAIEAFDTTRGLRLISFAFQYIANAIRDYSLDNRLIPVPRNKSKSFPNCPIVTAEVTEEASLHGMSLQAYRDYSANVLGVHISLRSRPLVVTPTSMDTPVIGDSENTSLGDIIADDNASADGDFMVNVDKEEVKFALRMLKQSEAEFITSFYTLDLTMEEFGEIKGISRQAVSCRLDRIMKKIRAEYVPCTL